MENDELVRALLGALETRNAALAADVERVKRSQEMHADDLAGLRAAMNLLVDLMAARGEVNEGHKRMVERIRQQTKREAKVVRLAMYVDKYQTPNSDIDCPSLIHLCHARCCAFSVTLTSQDVEERQLKWNISEPYMLLRDGDGYCHYIDRSNLGCTAYHHRPATCREFDCRKDRRVWLDWEKKIPAPIPAHISLPVWKQVK